jgi:hypothetical protein
LEKGREYKEAPCHALWLPVVLENKRTRGSGECEKSGMDWHNAKKRRSPVKGFKSIRGSFFIQFSSYFSFLLV